MNVFNLDREIFLHFIIIYLIILAGLSIIIILFSLFIKMKKIKYIRLAKKELEKMKEMEQTIFYKVGDAIENNICDFGKCVLLIKGFDAVCDTLRRHWDTEDKLKLTYTIKDEHSIDVELFFYIDGNWRKIEALYNLSDGINYVNRYEINFKVNEKIKSLLETLILCEIALWLGLISLNCMSLFIGV